MITEYFPKVDVTEQVTFVTLNFTGSGDNKLDVLGTTYFFGLTENDDVIKNSPVSTTQPVENSNDSLLWAFFAIPLVVIAVFVAIKIKKKN